MIPAFPVCLALTGLLPAAAHGAELIPAGSINSALAKAPIALIYEDHAVVEKHARGVRDMFFEGSELVSGEEALERDMSGFNLIVYGTLDGNEWLRDVAELLPFAYEQGGVRIQERHFEGEHLRTICAVRHPDNPERRAIIYAAARPEDIAGINAVFHGPTEWLVADGGRTLASGDYELTEPLSVETMRADLDFVIDKIATVHPATTGGVPRDVEGATRAARDAIAGPVGRAEFWMIVNRLLLSLGDAHTALGPQSSGDPFDLPVRWLSDGIVVRGDTQHLRRGDLVLAVGGLDQAKLLDGLRGLIPAETDVWVRHVGERALTQAGSLRALGLLTDEGLPLAVERGGERVELVLPVGAPALTQEQPMWVRFAVDAEASLGIFTLDSCRNDETYRSRLRAFFEAVHDQGLERVAIDVRRNSGGNSAVVDELLRYLDVDEYASYTGAVRVSEHSAAQRGTDGRDFGYHEFPPNRKRNERVADLPPFDGEVFVLTSPATFSSGNWFAVIFKDNGLGRIVGEPTGNAPSSYGDILTFTLPGSGFSFTMSFKKWLRPDRERDPAENLEPDELIPLTREDVISGRDPVLDYLRGLASER